MVSRKSEVSGSKNGVFHGRKMTFLYLIVLDAVSECTSDSALGTVLAIVPILQGQFFSIFPWGRRDAWTTLPPKSLPRLVPISGVWCFFCHPACFALQIGNSFSNSSIIPIQLFVPFICLRMKIRYGFSSHLTHRLLFWMARYC